MELDFPRGLKIAVLMGAVGEERQISLQSGGCIADALRRTKLVEVVEHDFAPDSPEILDDKTIDVFFLAFHGEFGEGGDMQGICESKNILYTGSGPEASRLAFDKIACKRTLAQADLPVADDVEIKSLKDLNNIDSKLQKMGQKFVVKPVRQGSSVGVSIVDGLQNAKDAAKECFNQFGDCMIEKFVKGKEITVGILGRKTLPVLEIKPTHQFFDYTAKYEDDNTQFLFDTIQDRRVLQKINDIALKSFDAVECRDFSRVDMILTEDNTPYVIEINTIPGFTTHSLLPKAAQKVGLDMSQLCLEIIKTALKRKN